MNAPISNGGNGRRADGTFAFGNSGGPGSPVSKFAVKFRLLVDGVLDEVCTRERLIKATEKCLVKAEGGDIQCYREILTRLVGVTPNRDLQAQMEDILAELQSDKFQRRGFVRIKPIPENPQPQPS